MQPSLETLRRRAKALKTKFAAGDREAVSRAQAILGSVDTLPHAQALHVIAREAGAESWPRLKFAVEAAGMDRMARVGRLHQALFHGQSWVVQGLLAETPDLAEEDFGLECALYNVAAVERQLAFDREVAIRPVRRRRPILHLAFSQHIHTGGSETDMLRVADLLLAHGADVDDSFPVVPDDPHALSALYGAIGHSNNIALGRWLLEHGANPNDNESLYHSVELGHHDGLKLLLAHGARPEGTNALLRAMDFNDLEAVRLLLEAGADPNEGVAGHPSGEPTWLIPALHQAARRQCSVDIAELLLDHGADPAALYQGHSAYALARVYGNAEISKLLETRGAATALSKAEAHLARAADGTVAPDDWIDMAELSGELAKLLVRLVERPEALPHMKRLVDIGYDFNGVDEMETTPLHAAGWQGLPESFAYFLSLGADMAHINGYGGTLFSTILHGSEHCPQRAERDHIGCMRQALEYGVALPRRALTAAGDESMAAFLNDWALEKPGQVVEEGVV